MIDASILIEEKMSEESYTKLLIEINSGDMVNFHFLYYISL